MQEDHIVCEEQLINILLMDKEAVKDWAVSPVTARFFDSSHKEILSAVQWAHNEGASLTRTTFKSFVEMHISTPAEVVAQMTVYNRISMRMTKKDDMPMLLQKIKQAYIRRKSIEYISRYAAMREDRGDIEANRTLTTQLTLLETDTVENKTVLIDVGESKDNFLKDLEKRKTSPEVRLMTGIAAIDQTMGVGLREGTLTIFCAAPSTFKTTIQMNVALNVFKQSGENVMFLPLEGGHETMLQRIISRETRIPFYKLERSELLTGDEVKRVAEEFDKWQSLQHRFKLLKMSDRAKVSTIRAEIERRINYFKPRVVFIDYADNIVPDRRQSRNDLELRDMFDDIIKMSEYYGFATVTAAKLTRESIKRMKETKDGKQEMDSTDVHGGQEFGGNATYMYGQIRNTAQPNSQLDFFCMKNRFGPITFQNGKMRETLMVDPSIGLIQSPEDMSFSDYEANTVDNGSMPPALEEDDSPF